LSFNNAFVPWLFERLKKSEIEVNLTIVRNTYIYFIVLAFAGLMYYILLPIGISLFVDQKFIDSLGYTSWLILGFVFQGMYYMVTNYIVFSGKTIVQSVITVSIGIMSLPLNYFLILNFGAIGASVSFSVSYLFMFLFTWIAAEKLYPMPWNLKIITAKRD
jgi:O-antigen/teichoic acid export membrane protein